MFKYFVGTDIQHEPRHQSTRQAGRTAAYAVPAQTEPVIQSSSQLQPVQQPAPASTSESAAKQHRNVRHQPQWNAQQQVHPKERP